MLEETQCSHAVYSELHQDAECLAYKLHREGLCVDHFFVGKSNALAGSDKMIL